MRPGTDLSGKTAGGGVAGIVGSVVAIVIGLCVVALLIAGTYWAIRAMLGGV